jgi:hypothetical protein
MPKFSLICRHIRSPATAHRGYDDAGLARILQTGLYTRANKLQACLSAINTKTIIRKTHACYLKATHDTARVCPLIDRTRAKSAFLAGIACKGVGCIAAASDPVLSVGVLATLTPAFVSLLLTTCGATTAVAIGQSAQRFDM